MRSRVSIEGDVVLRRPGDVRCVEFSTLDAVLEDVECFEEVEKVDMFEDMDRKAGRGAEVDALRRGFGATVGWFDGGVFSWGERVRSRVSSSFDDVRNCGGGGSGVALVDVAFRGLVGVPAGERQASKVV